VPGVIGEPGLATQRAGIVSEQFVVIAEHETWPLAEAREAHLPGAQQLGEQRAVEHLPKHQRQVVGRGAHARTIQPRWRGGSGIERAQPGCELVHLLDGLSDPTQLPGQGVCGVIT
jgi:hypothetical protein